MRERCCSQKGPLRKKPVSGQQKVDAQQRLLNFAKVLGNIAEDMANKEAERKADKKV